jgi:hypothetical protein
MYFKRLADKGESIEQRSEYICIGRGMFFGNTSHRGTRDEIQDPLQLIRMSSAWTENRSSVRRPVSRFLAGLFSYTSHFSSETREIVNEQVQ